MQKIRIWLWRFPVFLAIVAAAWLPQLAGAHDTRSYAYAQSTATSYRGVYGEIETTNPQIRDGGFSAEAIWRGSANAMGVSGHLYLMYRDSAGNWYYYNGWNQEHVDPGYYLARLSEKSHQTGGNN